MTSLRRPPVLHEQHGRRSASTKIRTGHNAPEAFLFLRLPRLSCHAIRARNKQLCSCRTVRSVDFQTLCSRRDIWSRLRRWTISQAIKSDKVRVAHEAYASWSSRPSSAAASESEHSNRCAVRRVELQRLGRLLQRSGMTVQVGDDPSDQKQRTRGSLRSVFSR